MKRSVDFSDSMMNKLKELADKKGVTVSAIIKIACSEFIEREENKK